MMQLLTELTVFVTPSLFLLHLNIPQPYNFQFPGELNTIIMYTFVQLCVFVDVVEHMQVMVYDCSIDLQAEEVFAPILSLLDLHRQIPKFIERSQSMCNKLCAILLKSQSLHQDFFLVYWPSPQNTSDTSLINI